MKIVVDIGHPAQVHLFRNIIKERQKRGDEVIITSTDKDVSLALLDEYGFKYINLGKTGKSFLRKVLSIPVLDWRFYRTVRDFKPDLFIGSGSFKAAHISRIMHKPCFMMVDTEATIKEHINYAPFTDVIATPHCLRRDLGKKQIRYNGFQELAYLHPHYFTPDISVLDELGVRKGEDYFIVRFVAWQATHDLGKKGFTLSEKRELINYLKQRGKVFVTAEGKLEDEFKVYQLPCRKARFLDALNFAKLLVAESHTVTTEAALMGVPAVRFNTYVGENDMGNFIELEQKYGLIYSFNEFPKALAKIKELLARHDLKTAWQLKKERLLAETVDLTQWVVDLIDQRWGSPALAGKMISART